MKFKDDEIGYPAKSNTGMPIKDFIFDWVVGRYKKHGHPWRKSDQRIFYGFIYGVSGYFGYLIFFALFGYLFWQMDKLFGFNKALLFALLMILFRINILIKQIVILNKKF